MVLAVVAALGIVLNVAGAGAFIAGILEFDMAHNVVHVLLAAVALGVGYGVKRMDAQRTIAKVVGVVYLALGAVGFVAPNVLGFVGLHLELAENLIHIALGAWGAYAGFTD